MFKDRCSVQLEAKNEKGGSHKSKQLRVILKKIIKRQFYSKKDRKVFWKASNLESLIEQENSYPRLILQFEAAEIPRLSRFVHSATFTSKTKQTTLCVCWPRRSHGVTCIRKWNKYLLFVKIKKLETLNCSFNNNVPFYV